MRGFVLAIVLGVSAWGQKFEVASIKPDHTGDRRTMFGMMPGGRFSATNVTVKQLIWFAYGLRGDYLLQGLPGWADSDHYDVVATPEKEEPGKMDQEEAQKAMRIRLQNLLAERFGLKVHPETKELPVYVLVVAKGGPKLVESKEGAPDLVQPYDGRGGLAPGAGVRTKEGGRAGGGRPSVMRAGRGMFTAQEASITALAEQLSMTIGRKVIDHTGLTGKYDIQLHWTPDPAEQGPKGPVDPGAEPPAENGPSLFTAIQEQLGLKLDSQKGPVEVYVIDHIEKPTEN
jgi:bla regulator protein BlaR1